MAAFQYIITETSMLDNYDIVYFITGRAISVWAWRRREAVGGKDLLTNSLN